MSIIEQAAQDQMALFAKPGIFFAHDDDGGVLMDINTDEYLALDPQGAIVWRCLAETPLLPLAAQALAVAASLSAEDAEKQVASYVEAWVSGGLLGPRTSEEPSAITSKGLGALPSYVWPSDAIEQARLSPACIWRLLAANRWVSKALARGGLAQALAELQATPLGMQGSHGGRQRVCRMVKAFRTIRSPFRQGREDCLMRSLQLARALRQDGVESDLCFGVQIAPFKAHAWVEGNGCVLSDASMRLDDFTLIARF